MGQSDGLRSAVFEKGSTSVISATFVKAFLVVWSVYLERDVLGSFEKMKMHRSYVRTTVRLHREKDLCRPHHDCHLCTPTEVLSEQEKSHVRWLFEMKGTHSHGEILCSRKSR